MSINIHKQIRNLSRVFHSEADFQHSLAWQLHQQYKEAKIRLERRVESSESSPNLGEMYIDIWAEINGKQIPIELKYKTKEFHIEMEDESIYLRSHGAHPPNRFDVIADIERVEEIVNSKGLEEGYVVFLTNDPAYWREPKQKNVIDADFRLHDELKGKLTWSKDASQQTKTKKRDRPIELRNDYQLDWKLYGYDEPKRMGKGKAEFRYFIIDITE